MLRNSNDNGHFCLGLTFYGNAFNNSLLSMLLISGSFPLSCKGIFFSISSLLKSNEL